MRHDLWGAVRDPSGALSEERLRTVQALHDHHHALPASDAHRLEPGRDLRRERLLSSKTSTSPIDIPVDYNADLSGSQRSRPLQEETKSSSSPNVPEEAVEASVSGR